MKEQQHHSADQQNSDSCLSSSRGNRRIPKPLGKFPILDYEIYSDVVSGNIELFLNPGKICFVFHKSFLNFFLFLGPRSKSKRRLTIYPEDFQERDKWVQALQEHSTYNTLDT
jgi:hypothetical protein